MGWEGVSSVWGRQPRPFLYLWEMAPTPPSPLWCGAPGPSLLWGFPGLISLLFSRYCAFRAPPTCPECAGWGFGGITEGLGG